MKLYGKDKVHHTLLERFIQLISAIHNFRLRPLLAVLKDYGSVTKEETKFAIKRGVLRPHSRIKLRYKIKKI